MRFLLLAFIVTLSACKKDKPNVELVQNMMESPAYKAQDYDPSAVDGRSMKVPPKGTVERNYDHYRFRGKAAEAEKYLRNPVVVSAASLERGKERYEVFCGVCHGATGLGDGPVAPKMLLAPPSLVSDKIKSWSDQGIYHIITDGRGMMGSYASQILPEDRWNIVNYVRELQKAAGK